MSALTQARSRVKRYVVLTGKARTPILETNDYARAVDIANFWDERQDTWLVDTHEDPFYALEAAVKAACEALPTLDDAYRRAKDRMQYARMTLAPRYWGAP